MTALRDSHSTLDSAGDLTTPERSPPTREPGWERRLAAWLVGLGALAVAGFLFASATREVLAAFFISLIVASAVRTPALALTRRLRLSFPWAAVLTYLAALLLAGLLLAVTLPGVIGEAQGIFSDRDRLQRGVAGLLQQLQSLTGGQLDLADPEGLSDQIITSGFHAVRWESVAAVAASGALWMLVVVALSFYWLMDRDRALASLLRRVPAQHEPRVRFIFEEIEDGLARFVLGQLAAGIIVGAIAAIGLQLLGVPFAISLGLILVICELLPAVGGWIAGILMTAVAANQSLWLGFVVLVLYFALQQLDGYVISPIVQQRAIHLRPVVVLLAVLLGGVTLGVTGALLGVPAAIAVTVLLRQVYPERDT